jgi:hypothetical protein
MVRVVAALLPDFRRLMRFMQKRTRIQSNPAKGEIR